MKNFQYTRQERYMLFWLRLLLTAFILAALLFVFIPSLLFEYLNNIGWVFFNFSSATVRYPTVEFWWVMSVGYKGVLAYVCFQAQRHWFQNHHFVPIIILGKVISAVGLTLLVFSAQPQFYYLVGAVTDGLIVLITWYFYGKALNSRSAISPHAA